jgi:hypothetical protein
MHRRRSGNPESLPYASSAAYLDVLSQCSLYTLRRTWINQFDPSSGTAINSYGEKVAPPQRGDWSSSCYICVLIFIIFYMFVVFGDMMSKSPRRQTCECEPADGFPHAVLPFRALFCLPALLCLLLFAKNRPCLCQ